MAKKKKGIWLLSPLFLVMAIIGIANFATLRVHLTERLRAEAQVCAEDREDLIHMLENLVSLAVLWNDEVNLWENGVLKPVREKFEPELARIKLRHENEELVRFAWECDHAAGALTWLSPEDAGRESALVKTEIPRYLKKLEEAYALRARAVKELPEPPSEPLPDCLLTEAAKRTLVGTEQRIKRLQELIQSKINRGHKVIVEESNALQAAIEGERVQTEVVLVLTKLELAKFNCGLIGRKLQEPGLDPGRAEELRNALPADEELQRRALQVFQCPPGRQSELEPASEWATSALLKLEELRKTGA